MVHKAQMQGSSVIFVQWKSIKKIELGLSAAFGTIKGIAAFSAMRILTGPVSGAVALYEAALLSMKVSSSFNDAVNNAKVTG